MDPETAWNLMLAADNRKVPWDIFLDALEDLAYPKIKELRESMHDQCFICWEMGCREYLCVAAHWLQDRRNEDRHRRQKNRD